MKITITLLNKKEWEVDATVVGDLAIHRRRVDESTWTITHIPTKLSMFSVLPKHITKDKKKLVEWAKRVQDEKKKDWLAMRKFKGDEVLSDPKPTHELRGRIRAHCLSVKE